MYTVTPLRIVYDSV